MALEDNLSLVRQLEQKLTDVVVLDISEFEAELKAIGPKIGSSGKPGIGKDGDGDGLCNESFGVGVPCPPSVPDVPLWSAKQQARLDKRRKTIDRFKNRKRKPATFEYRDIWNAIDRGDTESSDRMVAAIFTHEGLGEDGKYKSIVQWIRNPVGNSSNIEVTGRILDENDEVVGNFSRLLYKNKLVHHNFLTMQPLRYLDPDGIQEPVPGDFYGGKGIGSDFILESQAKYEDIGIEKIDVDTDQDGGYNWAVDGYDWQTLGSRGRFLEQMVEVLNDSEKDWFPNEDEKTLFAQLIAKAESESMDDPNRVTPYLFTLFTNSKKFMNNATWQGIKPADEGLPKKRQSVVSSLKEILGDDTESIWGATEKKRLDARRKVVNRRKERGRIENPPTIKMLRDATMKDSPKTVEVYGKPIFEFEGLGEKANTSAKITKINLWGTKPEENDAGIPPSIYFTGDYLNKSGKQIGTFSYTLRLDPVDGKMVVEHEHISISKKHRGTGIGSDHQLLVEEQLARMGFEESRLLATMEDGAYNWAVDGYDWENQTQKAKFLTHMQQILDDTKNEWFETKEERELFAKLIADAQKQKSASPKRITPYHFTLFPRAKEFMTKPLNWYGTRPIRKSPDK